MWYPCHLAAWTQTNVLSAVFMKEALHFGRTAGISRVERETVVVEVYQLGAQHVLDLRLSCARLT